VKHPTAYSVLKPIHIGGGGRFVNFYQNGSGGEVHHPTILGLGLRLGGELRVMVRVKVTVEVRVTARVRVSKLGVNFSTSANANCGGQDSN